jgi:hypothetical protein
MQRHSDTWELSFWHHLAVNGLGGVFILAAFFEFWVYGVLASIVAALGAAAVVAIIVWRVIRARALGEPERYACPRCLRVFGVRQLRCRLERENHAL